MSLHVRDTGLHYDSSRLPVHTTAFHWYLFMHRPSTCEKARLYACTSIKHILVQVLPASNAYTTYADIWSDSLPRWGGSCTFCRFESQWWIFMKFYEKHTNPARGILDFCRQKFQELSWRFMYFFSRVEFDKGSWYTHWGKEVRVWEYYLIMCADKNKKSNTLC